MASQYLLAFCNDDAVDMDDNNGGNGSDDHNRVSNNNKKMTTTTTTTTTMTMMGMETLTIILIPRFPIRCRRQQVRRARRWHQLHNQAGHTNGDHHQHTHDHGQEIRHPPPLIRTMPVKNILKSYFVADVLS